MKNVKNLLLTSSYIFVAYNILGILTWFKHIILLPLTLVVSFTISYLIFLKKPFKQNLKTGIVLTLPFCLILAITCFYVNDFSRGLSYILFIPLSTYLGFLYFKYKKLYIPILSISLFAFISFILFPNYFIYYYNHDAEKNITFSNVTFLDSKKQNVEFEPNKIIVLDFWSTSCGICFEKFPSLEETFQKYKGNPRVKIYSVNVPIRGDKFEKTITILDRFGYTFPKIYAKSSKQIEDSLHFNTFPRLMIIKDNKIRYDGYLETKKSSLLYNIEDQIDKLLKE